MSHPAIVFTPIYTRGRYKPRFPTYVNTYDPRAKYAHFAQHGTWPATTARP